MKSGYVYVNTEEQNTDRQEILMEQLAVNKTYIDKTNKKNTDHPELTKLKNYIREEEIAKDT